MVTLAQHRGGLRLALAVFIFAGVLLSYPPTSPGGVVWRDGFGENLDTSQWYAREGCPQERSAEGWLCYNPANAWTDGTLHVRQTPGGERLYEGGELASFKMGWGWPARDVRLAWAPPVRIEARIQFSGADNFWQAFTAWTTNRADVTELDIAEMRGQREHYMLCALHYNHNERQVHLGRRLPFNYTKAPHTYWIDYRADQVTFGVDDLRCGRTSLTTDAGDIGISFVGKSGSSPWTGGAVMGSPEFQVDWVRVSQ